LRELARPTTFAGMVSRQQWRRFMDHPVVEWTMFAVGIGLIVFGSIIATIPGPGGIFFIVPGLALVLKTSMWAKRHYVRFKRWQPKAGRWADWGLRRRSALRREALRKGEAPPNVEAGN
jgi:hypothetical protein